MEIWKDIQGFDGYQISDKGRVRTHGKITSNSRYDHRLWKDRIINQKVSKRDGRARVCLWTDGKEHTLLVHRIQAIAFLGEPQHSSMTVNHKDGNPLNNVVENLEWMSRADNIRYGFEHGQYPQKSVTLKDEEGNTYTFRSRAECSRFLGKSHGVVSMSIKNNRKFIKSTDGERYLFV